MSRKFKAIYGVFLFVSLFSSSLLHAFTNGDIYDAPGLDPHRETISSIPQEHIDPLTGGLTLSFEDIRLPGNGRLDLVIQQFWPAQKCQQKSEKCREISNNIVIYEHLI